MLTAGCTRSRTHLQSAETVALNTADGAGRQARPVCGSWPPRESLPMYSGCEAYSAAEMLNTSVCAAVTLMSGPGTSVELSVICPAPERYCRAAIATDGATAYV